MTQELLYPWKDISLPETLATVPTMLHPEALQYLMWLAREKFQGWGAVVDLGCWFGGSSAALAEGLRQQQPEAAVHSFDRFCWEPYMSAHASAGLRAGDDFLPCFVRETAEYSNVLQIHKIDLKDASWEDGPIEILFIDSANTWELMNAVFAIFGPHLVPGRSRIAVRDFRFHYAYCLPLIFDGRPDLWREEEDLEQGDIVTFVPLKPLFGAGGIDDSAYSEDSFPLLSAEHLLRRRISRESPSKSKSLLLSFYRKCLIEAAADSVEVTKNEAIARGIPEADLQLAGDVQDLLVARGWAALAQGELERARDLAEICLPQSLRRPAEALTLLACALIRAGVHERAAAVIEELSVNHPLRPPTRLLAIEQELNRDHLDNVEAQLLTVLRELKDEEEWIEWALHLLNRLWDANRITGSRLATLNELSARLSRSPSLLAHLARQQFLAGMEQESIRTVEQALAIKPGHKLAQKVWQRIGQARVLRA